MESVNYKELKDYIAIAQTEDINVLSLEYATMKEWALLSLVTSEIEKRNLEDKKQTKKTTSEIRPDDDKCDLCHGSGFNYGATGSYAKINCRACGGTGKRIVVGNKAGELK